MVTLHSFQTHRLTTLLCNNGSSLHRNSPCCTSIKTTDYWSSSPNGTANIMLYSCRRQEHTFSITFKLNSYHCTQKHCAGKSWKSESIIWSDKFAFWYRNKIAHLASESFPKCMKTMLSDVITVATSEANVRKHEFAKSGFKRLPSPEVHKIPRKFLLICQFKPAIFCNSFR